MDLEVKVRGAGVARRADRANNLASLHPRSSLMPSAMVSKWA